MRVTGLVVRTLIAFALAVVVATALAAVAQTQFNLAALYALGAEIGMDVRVRTTLQDLAGFSPMYGLVTAIGFFIALAVASPIVHFAPKLRLFGFTLAGAVAVLAAILLMNSAFGMHPIAATRSVAGLAAFVLTGAAGGFLYALFAPRRWKS